MSSVESKIKNQYSKFFQTDDCSVFKQMAEYYLESAVHLKKKDINQEKAYKLWIRNVQKRLFIGLACELLLKSHFLKHGYGINVPKSGSWHLYKIQNVLRSAYREDNTFSMNFLLDQLKNGPKFVAQQSIEKGFRIAKVFRNKEGHVAVYWHKFDDQNYTDIETSLVLFYKEAFTQNLSIRFSFKSGESGIFNLD